MTPVSADARRPAALPGRPGTAAPVPRPVAPPHPGTAARVLRAGVRGYQVAFGWRPSPCRFTPTCSAYAIEALETHGALRGLGLTLRRLGRCHPWGPHGWDPVPDRKVP
jgi:uncharacterized protein